MSQPGPSRDYLERKTWEEKARENPLYAVMSVDRFVESNAGPTDEELQEFFAEGRSKTLKWIVPWLQETKTTSEMKLLEFGCGMGRLLKNLEAFHAPRCLAGVDISETMVAHARNHLHEDVDVSVISPDGSFRFQDGEFDRVFSYAVFQHISRKSIVLRSIAEISRVLKIGGKVKIQMAMESFPPFECRRRTDTYAFETWSLRYRKMTCIPLVPIMTLQVLKANEWRGIRLGYHQLFDAFERNHIRIHGLVREYPQYGFVWFYGEKY